MPADSGDDAILNIDLEDLENVPGGLEYPAIEPGADLEEALGRKLPGPQITVICSATRRQFIVHFEAAGDQAYEAVSVAQVEGKVGAQQPGDQAQINGRFGLTKYPGCPYCGARGLAVCACGTPICEGSLQKSLLGGASMVCPACGETVTIGGPAASVHGQGGKKKGL